MSRRVPLTLLPLLAVAACVPLSQERRAPPSDEPFGGYAPIIIRRQGFNGALETPVPQPAARPQAPAAAPPPPPPPATTPRPAVQPAAAAPPPRPTPPVALAAATPAPAARAAAPVAPPPPPAPPPPLEIPPLAALPTREMKTVAALSDTDSLGPIQEMPVPSGGSAYHPVVAARPPAPRPVQCKALRTREGSDDKVTVSCHNSGKTPQRVFVQIDAPNMSGVPPAEQAKAGVVLPPGKGRQIAVLTVVRLPFQADIFFTHEEQH